MIERIVAAASPRLSPDELQILVERRRYTEPEDMLRFVVLSWEPLKRLGYGEELLLELK